MLSFEQTGVEELHFGDQPEDIFTILVNRKVSPNGIDLEKLKLADPRNFDATLERLGCLIMLNGEEMEELYRRNDLVKENLHESLYNLAKEEGLLD